MSNLDYKYNRLDYGRILMPPTGYSLVRGIGTTYSLDLEALIAVPVALLYSKTLEGEITPNRFDIIDSINQTSDIVRVYCQKGQIKVPGNTNLLLPFLEDAVSQVMMDSYRKSFHPKTWTLVYENSKGEQRVRFIVLSRNLTFDRSWDVAVTLEGEVGSYSKKKNEPLVDFLNFLFEQDNVDDAEYLAGIISKTDFELSGNFSDYQFFPIGISTNHPNPLKERSFSKFLAVSPFLDNSTLKAITEINPGKKFLFSRKEELLRMNPGSLENYKTYFLSDLISGGEFRESIDDGEMESPQWHQLHAKLYVGEEKNFTSWFIGSANLSDPAMTRNVEFLLHLTTDNEECNVDAVKNQLIGDPEVFEEFKYLNATENEMEENIEEKLRKIRFDIVSSSITGKFTPGSSEEIFDLSLGIDLREISWDHEFEVNFLPLNFNQGINSLKSGEKNEFIFIGINETRISRFFAFEIIFKGRTVKKFLVKVPLENIPETRLKKIFKKLIDSREKFFQYIRFLLSDTPFSENILLSEVIQKNNSPSHNGFGFQPEWPIYEQMLKAASRDKKKLKSIDRLIDRLAQEQEDSEENLIPDEFISFWKIFKSLT